MSGSELISSNFSYGLSPKCLRNSFKPATFHLRPCRIPRISTGFMDWGTFLPPNAPAQSSMASAMQFTSSSSLKKPLGPRLKPPKTRSDGSSAVTVSQHLGPVSRTRLGEASLRMLFSNFTKPIIMSCVFKSNGSLPNSSL